ncbi:hypothetical protein [Carboxydothermus pertinax]|uniref:hypothetical protein n=1 Tax=Carboxydothermus pertinax TaxID=870242 RepID=UPI00096A9881|nr:hypothetical protein [Carboxydothermus pertinax]
MLKAVRLLLIFLVIALAALLWCGETEVITVRDSLPISVIVLAVNSGQIREKRKQEPIKIKLFANSYLNNQNENKLKYFTNSRWYQTSYFDIMP